MLVRTSMIDQRYSPRVCFLNVLSPTSQQTKRGIFLLRFLVPQKGQKGILTYYYVFSVNFLERKKEQKKSGRYLQSLRSTLYFHDEKK